MKALDWRGELLIRELERWQAYEDARGDVPVEDPAERPLRSRPEYRFRNGVLVEVKR